MITDCSVFFSLSFVGTVVVRGDGGEAGHTHTHTVVVVDVVVGMMLALFSFFQRCPSLLPRFLPHLMAEKKKGEPPALCAFDQSPRKSWRGKRKGRNEAVTTSCCLVEKWEHLCDGWVDTQWTEAQSLKRGLSPRGGCVLCGVFFRGFRAEKAQDIVRGQGRLYFCTKEEAKCTVVFRKAPFWHHLHSKQHALRDCFATSWWVARGNWLQKQPARGGEKMREEAYLFLLNKKKDCLKLSAPLRKRGTEGFVSLTASHPCGGAAACVPPLRVVTVGACLFSVFAPPPLPPQSRARTGPRIGSVQK